MAIKRIYADISELFAGAEQLVLDDDATAGASTLTVKSITGVTINNILCLREPGSEHAEIIATHASTAPSGNTVTLATTLVESHPRGTTVFIIRANTVRFYHSATAADANSDDSSLSALAAAQAIDPTMFRNFYEDTVQTSGYYYYRFIDSVNTVNLNYSGPIPWAVTGARYNPNQVGFVLEFVRRKMGHEWDDRFSKEAAIQEIGFCLRYIQGKLKRWPRHFVADYVLGQTARGVFTYTLPTDIYDAYSNRSILQVRIGTAIEPLIMLDEKEFDTVLADAAHTQVRTQPAVGATTLAVDNSYDFSSTGTLHVFTSNTLDSITYTGVTRSATAGIFTGVPASGDGSIEATHAVDSNVWQGESEGRPRYGNISNGSLRVYPLPDSTWINKNVVIDYSRVATAVDTEEDTLDAERYDMVVSWLLWQGDAYWRNNGKADINNSDLKMFNMILKDAIRISVNTQKHKWHPKINQIKYEPTGDTRFDYT